MRRYITMKRSIKFVLILCMLFVTTMPVVSWAAAKDRCVDLSRYNAFTKISMTDLKKDVVQLKNLFSNKYTGEIKIVLNQKPVPKAKDEIKKPAPSQQKKVAESEREKPVVPRPEKPEENNNKPAVTQPVAAVGSTEKQVADLVNKERSAQGLAPLKFNGELSKVAKLKATDMRDKNYFSHTSPTYGSPFDMMKSFGIRYTSAGENIAKGYRTPDAVMKGWMNSPGHKANILNSSFTEIGVGYVTDSSGTGYWVQMFIRP